MATKKKEALDAAESVIHDMMDFINKDAGANIAYRLDDPNNPSNIRGFISTGIKGLDYIISNRKNGGIPIGRITNFYGGEGSGKSLLGIKTAVECQRSGGFVVYFDAESALDKDFPTHLGLDPKRTLVLGNLTCEKVFGQTLKLIDRFRQNPNTKDCKLLFIWDSVNATPTEAEEAGDITDYTKLMGVKPRILGAGFRKIGDKIARENVAMLVINQVMIDIGVKYGDNEKQSGGKQLVHWMSVIAKISKVNAQAEGTGELKEGKSVDVKASILKNRCGPPLRVYQFTMNYLEGPQEHEQILTNLNRIEEAHPVLYNGKEYMFKLHQTKGWYTAYLYDATKNPDGSKDGATVLKTIFQKGVADEKFTKNAEWEPVVDQLLSFVWERHYAYDGEGRPESSYEMDIAEDEMMKIANGLSGDSDDEMVEED